MSKNSESLKSVADSIMVSSRIRLARNFGGVHFPDSASSDSLKEILQRSLSAIKTVKNFKNSELIKMDSIPALRRDYLVEERLITRDLADSTDESAVVVSSDGACSIMINEEDHLRLQVYARGQNLRAIWKTINSVDDALAKNIEFAFDGKYGYLTSCPSNVGTAMRASLMMHLPALVLSGHADKMMRGASQIGMIARGENGEGSEPMGSFFQISNQQTLGLSENQILEKILRVCESLRIDELNARQKLLQENAILLADKIARSWAVLNSCELINTVEAIGCISYLRLAADLGFFGRSRLTVIERLDNLILQIKPAHLHEFIGVENADTQLRDSIRARFVKSIIKTLPVLSLKKLNIKA